MTYNNEFKNDKKDLIDLINEYGTPYYIKFFVILAIFGSVFIIPGDVFTRAINVGVTIATLSIDMWVIKKQSHFTIHNKLKNIHFFICRFKYLFLCLLYL